jgi:periplasmic protein CpxP/Spy
MKKLNKFSMLVVAAVLAGILAIPFAFGQSSGAEQGDRQAGHSEKRFGGKHGWHHGRRGGLFRGLNLTDAQKDQIKQIRVGYFERTKSLRAELRAKHQELRQARSGGSFDEALASQKLAEMAPLNAKLMGEGFKMRQEMIAVLTPEQKTQLEQKRELFKQKREEFKAKRAERKADQN